MIHNFRESSSAEDYVFCTATLRRTALLGKCNMSYLPNWFTAFFDTKFPRLGCNTLLLQYIAISSCNNVLQEHKNIATLLQNVCNIWQVLQYYFPNQSLLQYYRNNFTLWQFSVSLKYYGINLYKFEIIHMKFWTGWHFRNNWFIWSLNFRSFLRCTLLITWHVVGSTGFAFVFCVASPIQSNKQINHIFTKAQSVLKSALPKSKRSLPLFLMKILSSFRT